MPQPPSSSLRKTAVTLLLFFFMAIPFSGLASENESRNDLIFIQLSDDTVTRQMPDALFLHDKHTQTMPDQDCSKCHMKEKNAFVFKFNRVTDAGYDSDKKLYHDKCIGCHLEKRDQGIKSGPMTSECRLCHTQTSAYTSSAQPFGLNKSLHYRHEISKSIQSTAPSESKTDDKDWNCGACHHEYDKDLNKTIYIKGKEGTCRYCHKTEKTEDARSFKTVAHEDCLNCHYQLKTDNKKAGPTDCSGCHDADRQSKIETIEDVPRIKRNQPDAVLLSLWLKEAVKSGKPSQQFTRPVAFNHLSHETNIDTCYSCHHESMDTCNTCHTRLGTEKNKYTRLGSAMHSTESPISHSSCIGCHSSKLQDKNCAGCHAQMSKKSFSDSDCNKCHTITRKSMEPIPADDKETLKIAEKIAESEINLWTAPKSLVPEKDIPENVTIDIMKDQYEGTTFPHRKIVKTLSERIQESKLATHFHGEPQTMCAGCHHHSPASVTPPKCASCHGISTSLEPDGRPGLKGAYHGQCIRCHQEMGIEKPAATDCVSCHKLKTRSAQQAD